MQQLQSSLFCRGATWYANWISAVPDANNRKGNERKNQATEVELPPIIVFDDLLPEENCTRV
ncbi:phage portal, lambda family protein [Anopheles sinensis]|uniref:Phage portal, lambda family protein n=1 Tax=Anopheles sinensis TaxID=74873 RepID=A0A084W8T1_ANOSI|nr:phage portal, lambda family protein [Anopheles sinensis]